MEGSLARALYTYQSNNPGELSVPEGSIIRITQYINNHWLEANYQGQTGLFPVTYAERLKNEPQLQDSSTMPSHDDELQEKYLSSWRGQNHEFYQYRQTDVLAKHSNGDGSYVETAFAFSARNDSELTFPSGALIEVTNDIDEDWLEGSFNGKTGLFPKSYLKSSERPCARAVYPFVGESVGELTFREGDCIFLRKRLNSQWMEGEIDGKVGLFPSSFIAVEVELPPEQNAFVNGDFNLMDSPSKDGVQNSALLSKIKWEKGMKGRALFHFTALYSGDLELNEGDVVTVLEVDDDNWIEGQLANGMRGSCPAAYLEPVYDTSRQYENKPLKASTSQRFGSDASFTGIFGDLVSDTGYINTSSQQTNDFVDSYTKRGNNTYKSLLDSSFTQDPTPALLPSNMATTETHETVQRTKPSFKPKPTLRTKPSQNYSVTYLGGEDRGELSVSRTVSPSVSMPTLPGGNVPGPSSREAFRGSAPSETLSNRCQIPTFIQDSAGTWPGKRAGIHADEKKNRKNFIDDYDLVSGNCTSLPTPLVPLPQAGIDDRNSESSTSEDSPITPRRPAPPPPKRDSSSKNHARSSTLPGTRSKGLTQSEFSREVSPSKAKDQQVLDGKEMKQNGRPHTPSPTESKRDSSSISIKGSPKIKRAGDSTKPKPLSRPRSVHWKGRDSSETVEKVYV